MQKTCSKCGKEWVPSFSDDCYSVNGVDLCEGCALADLMKPREPVPIEESHVENVCIPRQSATCAFLGVSPEGFSCLKSSDLEDAIREKLRNGSLRNKGDNCSGPAHFTISG